LSLERRRLGSAAGVAEEDGVLLDDRLDGWVIRPAGSARLMRRLHGSVGPRDLDHRARDPADTHRQPRRSLRAPCQMDSPLRQSDCRISQPVEPLVRGGLRAAHRGVRPLLMARLIVGYRSRDPGSSGL